MSGTGCVIKESADADSSTTSGADSFAFPFPLRSTPGSSFTDAGFSLRRLAAGSSLEELLTGSARWSFQKRMKSSRGKFQDNKKNEDKREGRGGAPVSG
jgi:hypothetical protein